MAPESGAIYSSVIKEMGRLERLLDVAIGRWYHGSVRAESFNERARLVSEQPDICEGLGRSSARLQAELARVGEIRMFLDAGGELYDRLRDATLVLEFAQMLKELTTSLDAFNNDVGALTKLYLASVIVDLEGALIEPDEAIRHVVTAWNPAGEVCDEARNRELNDTLRGELEAAGGVTEPVIGKSEEGSWSEESWLVTGLDRVRVAALAGEFDQIAFFELEGSEVRVIESS